MDTGEAAIDSPVFPGFRTQAHYLYIVLHFSYIPDWSNFRTFQVSDLKCGERKSLFDRSVSFSTEEERLKTATAVVLDACTNDLLTMLVTE